MDWRYWLFMLLALLASCQGDPNHNNTSTLPTLAPTAVVPTTEITPTLVASSLENPFAGLIKPYIDDSGNLKQALPYEEWKNAVKEVMAGVQFEEYMHTLEQEAPQELFDSLVHIGLMDSPTGIYGFCSGTLLGVINEHVVIATSAHCLVDLGAALEDYPGEVGLFTSENFNPTGLTITQPHKEQGGVKSMTYDLGPHNVKYDPRRDLALIRIPENEMFGEVLINFPIATTSAPSSEQRYYIGIPYFTGKAYAGETTVTGDPYFIRGASYQSMGGINFPGMSGGPVVNQKGEIEGILGSIADNVGSPPLNIYTQITPEMYNVVSDW